MGILIIDSHVSHVAVVKAITSLCSCELLYYSDTRGMSFDEVSGFARVSRLLTLIDAQLLRRMSTVVLLGRGMSSEPRDAIEAGAKRAGLNLIFAADLLADHVFSVLRPGGLCVIGDSCLTAADARGKLGHREWLEVRWARLAPRYGLDEPVAPILKHWKGSVGAYLLATPENKRVVAEILRVDPGAEIIDEYEQLALAIASLLPEGPVRTIDVCVTDQTPAITERIKRGLGVDGGVISEFGRLEQGPAEGPFALSLDWFGSVA